ncbi:MAG TPA: 4Fe-4S dicluster domain-containing protein [Tepidisphaeraceae bacterium]|nr:4Fe-4S dicluster domain-containing protein [Tepidisphaeraceae bacterium]
MPLSPLDSSLLRPVDTPARLHVPLATRAKVESPVAVAPGTVVAHGEALARGAAEGGAQALAPTSGRVVGVSTVTLTNGQDVPAVELEVDYEDRRTPEAPHTPEEVARRADPIDKASPDALGLWIDRLRGHGVWADRLTSPDLIGQLHQILRRPIDTIVCNAVDHDPGVRLQSVVGARFGSVLVRGLELLARLTSARNTWVAIEAGGQPKWWQPLRREMRDAGVELAPVLADYPQADPTLLVYALLRRRLRPGRPPVEQGVLVLDAAAAVAVGRAAWRDQPMLHVPVAVRDHLRGGRTHYLAVPIGTPVRHLLDHLKLPHDGVGLFRGDVPRGQLVCPTAIVAGGELVLHVRHAMPPVIPDPCIRCGWCAHVCPTRVHPAGVLEAAQRGDQDLADHYGIDACVECGVCDEVCPSHLPLLGGIRHLKAARHGGE